MPNNDRDHPWFLLTTLGFIGLLSEALGIGLVFAWFQETPRTFADPRLFIGAVLAIIGFVVIIRGLSWIIKQIIMMTIAEN